MDIDILKFLHIIQDIAAISWYGKSIPSLLVNNWAQLFPGQYVGWIMYFLKNKILNGYYWLALQCMIFIIPYLANNIQLFSLLFVQIPLSGLWQVGQKREYNGTLLTEWQLETYPKTRKRTLTLFPLSAHGWWLFIFTSFSLKSLDICNRLKTWSKSIVRLFFSSQDIQ